MTQFQNCLEGKMETVEKQVERFLKKSKMEEKIFRMFTTELTPLGRYCFINPKMDCLSASKGGACSVLKTG